MFFRKPHNKEKIVLFLLYVLFTLFSPYIIYNISFTEVQGYSRRLDVYTVAIRPNSAILSHDFQTKYFLIFCHLNLIWVQIIIIKFITTT